MSTHFVSTFVTPPWFPVSPAWCSYNSSVSGRPQDGIQRSVVLYKDLERWAPTNGEKHVLFQTWGNSWNFLHESWLNTLKWKLLFAATGQQYSPSRIFFDQTGFLLMGQKPMWINPVYTVCIVSPQKIEPSLWLFSHLLDIKVNIWTLFGTCLNSQTHCSIISYHVQW